MAFSSCMTSLLRKRTYDICGLTETKPVNTAKTSFFAAEPKKILFFHRNYEKFMRKYIYDL